MVGHQFGGAAYAGKGKDGCLFFLLPVKQLLHGGQKVATLHRLYDIAEGAHLVALHRVIHGGCHNEDGNLVVQLADVLCHLDAAHGFHAHV